MVMRFSVLIGPYARGDFNSSSDCDVLLINESEEALDLSNLPTEARSRVSFIKYDEATFRRLYQRGSLFLFHALREGVVLDGDQRAWAMLLAKFQVQDDYSAELAEIAKATDLLSRTRIFGGKYLTPLVNAFTEVKNACIFSLAHKSIYELNKARCFEIAIGHNIRSERLQLLKSFYDYSVRGVDTILPFDPNDVEVPVLLLKEANSVVKGMYRACGQRNHI